jgi:hypothetical protein
MLQGINPRDESLKDILLNTANKAPFVITGEDQTGRDLPCREGGSIDQNCVRPADKIC